MRWRGANFFSSTCPASTAVSSSSSSANSGTCFKASGLHDIGHLFRDPNRAESFAAFQVLRKAGDAVSGCVTWREPVLPVARRAPFPRGSSHCELLVHSRKVPAPWKKGSWQFHRSGALRGPFHRQKCRKLHTAASRCGSRTTSWCPPLFLQEAAPTSRTLPPLFPFQVLHPVLPKVRICSWQASRP